MDDVDNEYDSVINNIDAHFSSVDRDFQEWFVLDAAGTPRNDLRLFMHKNGASLLSLAPSHHLISQWESAKTSTIRSSEVACPNASSESTTPDFSSSSSTSYVPTSFLSIDFDCNDPELHRKKPRTKKFRKKDIILKPESIICTLTAAPSLSFSVPALLYVTLHDLNPKLDKNPDLLLADPLDTGYIALVHVSDRCRREFCAAKEAPAKESDGFANPQEGSSTTTNGITRKATPDGSHFNRFLTRTEYEIALQRRDEKVKE